MLPVTIRKVENAHDYKAFFEFPWTLYKDDPNWVPPLLSMRHETFDKTKNAAWEYMDGDYFAAWRGEQPVGTIAAFINHRHNEFHDERVGWFGAFEVIDDPEAAQALLTTAADWVKERGYPIIRGPQTFTTHEETGLLVEGFERPILLYPYNKPYYEGFVRVAGFEPVMDTHAFYINAEEARINQLPRLERLAKGLMRRGQITVRQFDASRKKEEFALLKELYNAAWEKNWGFVPLTPRELDAMIVSLGQFFDPKLAFFAFVNGEPAGLVMAIWDFNQVLQKAHAKPGTPELLTLAKALWYWKVRPVMDWIRVPLMGVKEEYRNKGADVVMYYYVMDAAIKGGCVHSDSGWILATNKGASSVTLNAGGHIHRTYRYFDKSLT
ncbi:MAG TPA: hypothetical protein VER79_14565 [Candidatus Limnocylindrales bacterium]|nr:hypothetical protein [Candidatus Limnocylindrales bacterium]